LHYKVKIEAYKATAIPIAEGSQQHVSFRVWSQKITGLFNDWQPYPDKVYSLLGWEFEKGKVCLDAKSLAAGVMCGFHLEGTVCDRCQEVAYLIPPKEATPKKEEPVESQEDLWSEVSYKIALGSYGYLKDLQAQFTITRKP